jgi:peptidoglycan hydrolase-like protein with peptidoglycan-binding domain
MNHGPTIRSGSTGNDVRRLQRLLVMMKSLGFDEVDGVFGAHTDAAVRGFQSGNGLTVDGVVGPQTWNALPADPDTPQLGQGAHGAVVTALQKALRLYRGPATPTDPGAADGAFGPKTEAAVEAYQADRGVAADGIVGDRTWWVPSGAAGATLASLAGLTTV